MSKEPWHSKKGKTQCLTILCDPAQIQGCVHLYKLWTVGTKDRFTHHGKVPLYRRIMCYYKQCKRKWIVYVYKDLTIQFIIQLTN